MARRTKAEAERTRDEIIEAAEATFFAKGVTRTTLDDVARAAGVTRGAVYWHFKNKDDLFLAMHDCAVLWQEELVLRASLDTAINPLTELMEACLSCMGRMAGDARRRRVAAILILRCEYTDEMSHVLERKREANEAMRARLAASFRLARERGLLSAHWTPEVAARALSALLLGVVRDWLEEPETFDLTREGAEVVGSFFRALAPAEQAAPQEDRFGQTPRPGLMA